MLATLARLRAVTQLRVRLLLLALSVLGAASSLAGRSALQEAEAPERGAHLEALETKLAAHRYFKGIEWEIVETHAPVTLVLQKPHRAQEGWQLHPGGLYGPWLRELEALFQSEFAAPFGLERRATHSRLTVVVLATAGDFSNYCAAPGVRGRSWIDTGAALDPKLELVVCHAGRSTQAPHLDRGAVLTQAARWLLAAHDGGKRPWPEELWLSWGLPAYLAYSPGTRPESLRERRVDQRALSEFMDVLRDPRRASATLLPLEELVRLRSRSDLERALTQRAAARGTPVPDINQALRLVFTSSVLWMHHLNQREGAFDRAAFGRVLSATLSGVPLAVALEAELAALEGVDLDREFLTFLFEWEARQEERAPTDLSLVDTLLASWSANDTVEVDDADLAELGLGAADVALRHALALGQARSGDLTGALATLEALLQEAEAGPEREHAEREVVRVRAFEDLRRRFLDELVSSGGKLRLERGGKRWNLVLEAVEGDSLQLAPGRSGLASLALGELESYALARQIGRKVAGEDSGWARIYPYVLAGDELWRKRLSGADPAAVALREDADAWYPSVLALAPLARALSELAGAPVPEDVSAAADTLARIEALVALDPGLQVLRTRLDGLRRLASVALDLMHEEGSELDDLSGAHEVLPGGGVRLSYTFDDAAELDDFARQAYYPPDRAKDAPPLFTAPDGPGLRVERGALRGAGSTTLRLQVPFSGPIRVRMLLDIAPVPRGGQDVLSWTLGAHDDGAGAHVGLYDMGSVISVDRANGYLAWAAVDGGQSIETGRSYELVLVCDEERVRSLVDGVELRDVELGPRKQGDVFLAIHGDTPVAIHELEVVGTPSAALGRKRWLERRLDELGL